MTKIELNIIDIEMLKGIFDYLKDSTQLSELALLTIAHIEKSIS